MIKTYFFDWMGTVGKVVDVANLGKFLGEKNHLLQITSDIDDSPLSVGEREIFRRALYDAQFSLYSDSQEVIARLKRERKKLAIVSNVYPITPQRLRDLFPEFLSQFDVITFSSEVGMRKPDLEIYRYTLGRLNKLGGKRILPEEVMMIGNEYGKDVAPPLILGMQARLIDRSKQALEDVL